MQRRPGAQYSFAWGGHVVSAVLLAGLFASAASLNGYDVPVWFLAGTVVVGIALLAVGVIWMPSGVFAPAIVGSALRDDDRRLSLTFDDGPDAQFTLQILELLRGTRHRATFFLIGERAERHPEVVEAIIRDGHSIANHTYRHHYLSTFFTVGAMQRELDRTSAVLAKHAGSAPRWIRPPVGLVSPRIARAVQRCGLELVSWTATARDGTDMATLERSLSRLTRAIRPGAILVMHDTIFSEPDQRPVSLELLPRLLRELDARGFVSVTLDELLMAPAPASTASVARAPIATC